MGKMSRLDKNGAMDTKWYLNGKPPNSDFADTPHDAIAG
jgi:hypothetical protein